MNTVTTPGDMVDLISTGKAPEFVPPTKEERAAPPKAVEVAPEQKPEEKPEAKAEIKPEALRERNEDGTFKEVEQSTDDAGEQLSDKVRKQIGKKHRQMKEAEEYARSRDTAYNAEKARADRAEAELKAFRQNDSTSHRPDALKAGDPAANPEKFKTNGEYITAKVEYEVAKTAQAAKEAGEQQTAQQKQQAQIDATAKVYADRQAEYIKTNPDYVEALEASDVEIPNVALNYIVKKGLPQLAHYLLRNEAEAERLTELINDGPEFVLAELGRMEGKLESKPAKAKVQQLSQAPAPATSIVPGTSGEATQDPSKMGYDEYRVWKDAQRRSQRRA